MHSAHSHRLIGDSSLPDQPWLGVLRRVGAAVATVGFLLLASFEANAQLPILGGGGGSGGIGAPGIGNVGIGSPALEVGVPGVGLPAATVQDGVRFGVSIPSVTSGLTQTSRIHLALWVAPPVRSANASTTP